MKRETFDVVGLKHRTSNWILVELKKQLPLTAKVKREPKNEADKNAIAVFIFSKNLDRRGYKIGYLRRAVAKEIAPKLDDGSMVISKAKLTAIDVEDGQAEVEIGLNKGKIHP